MNFSIKTLSLIAATLIAAIPATLCAQDPTIAAGDAQLTRFADSVVDFSPATALSEFVSNPNAALGAPDVGSTGDPDFNPVGLVSLGDPGPDQAAGSITVGFSTPVNNSLGEQIAVFSNSFGFEGSVFAELAFVEVSSDGINFTRFENSSSVTAANSNPANPLTDLELDFSGNLDFATIPNRNLVSGFAGADDSNFGTVFDLNGLANDATVLDGILDLNSIGFVRILDIPGDGRFVDSFGNPIFDAFSPNNITGGFDLDAVGVVSATAVPEPSSLALIGFATSIAVLRRRRNN